MESSGKCLDRTSAFIGNASFREIVLLPAFERDG